MFKVYKLMIKLIILIISPSWPYNNIIYWPQLIYGPVTKFEDLTKNTWNFSNDKALF